MTFDSSFSKWNLCKVNPPVNRRGEKIGFLLGVSRNWCPRKFSDNDIILQHLVITKIK